MLLSRILCRGLVPLSLLALSAGPGGAAPDLKSMRPADLTALQHRLTDAGCYNGPADGVASAETLRAVQACPDQDPILRIETGMHASAIKRIGVDRACSKAITGADDKTVRLWSLPDGQLQRTIRLPIGAGNGGKIYAVAMSPDGRYAAAGGWDAGLDKGLHHGLYLIDLGNFSIHRIGSFENVINHIAISQDGARIAVGLGRANGIRVIDAGSGRELMADRAYADQVYGLAFTADGTLFSASYDGNIRRYGPNLALSAKARIAQKQVPYGIAVDPSAQRVAIGVNDIGIVSIFNARTLKLMADADTKDVKDGDLSSVAWSRDGRVLASGGLEQEKFDGQWRTVVRRFDPDGHRLGQDLAVSNGTVFDIAACGDGFAYATADPRFGLIAADGGVNVLQTPPTLDLRDKLRDNFTVSEDGTSVRFGAAYGGRDPIVFDLMAGNLTASPNPPAGFTGADVTGLPVADWEDKTRPTLGGRPISLEPYETSRSVAVRPDRAGFVLGSEWNLRGLDARGKELWVRPVTGLANGVILARQGALILAAQSDGTIRWSRWSDGTELLSLFIHGPTRRWVAWTPSGYYTASPGGEDLIGWHVNRGWEQEADFFPASRFRDKFNRPDVVRKVLQTLDEAEALRQADAESHRQNDRAPPVTTKLPPVIRVQAPAGGGRFSDPHVTLAYDLRSPSGLTVERVDVLVDGRPLTTRGLGAASAVPATPSGGSVQGQVTLDLPRKDVDVALIARAGDLASTPSEIHLTYAGAAPAQEEVAKPKLYLLAVGVADYADPDLKLGLPAKDARDFAAAFKAQEGGLYAKVETKVIVDREVTRDSVIDGLDWLEKQTTSRDMAVLFLAGHGTTDEKGGFWFIPSDATPKTLRTRALSQDDLRRTLQALPGKALMFIDACHAAKGAITTATRGTVDINSIINDFSASENGVVTFASSTGRELSQENQAWGNGAFTKAVVEGLAGKADHGRGSVTLSGLDEYIADRVKELTEGTQHPVMTRPPTVSNFALAVTK